MEQIISNEEGFPVLSFFDEDGNQITDLETLISDVKFTVRSFSNLKRE